MSAAFLPNPNLSASTTTPQPPSTLPPSPPPLSPPSVALVKPPSSSRGHRPDLGRGAPGKRAVGRGLSLTLPFSPPCALLSTGLGLGGGRSTLDSSGVSAARSLFAGGCRGARDFRFLPVLFLCWPRRWFFDPLPERRSQFPPLPPSLRAGAHPVLFLF